MVRSKKATSESKTTKCAPTRRMPVTSTSGNGGESGKVKKRATSGDSGTKSTSGGISTGRGKQTEKDSSAAVVESGSTSSQIITTPSRLNHPFLRSRVKRPARTQSPTPGPSQEKNKEPEKTEPPKAERKRWEAWSNQDKELFFEAVTEHGKDFEAIQKYIEQRHKKLGYPPNQIKNKDQVRHLYYRTCHKLLKFITLKPERPRVTSELYALINYGELRKKIKGGLNAKNGQKLNDLVTVGVTSIRYKGRNVKVKTPVCKALKRLNGTDKDGGPKPLKLPARVLLELQPRSNAAWAEVQGVAHNPRLRLVVPLQKDMGNLLTYLSEKWTPHRLRLLHSLKPTDKSNFSQVKVHVPNGNDVIPYHKLQGRFIHANSKTQFTLVAEEDHETTPVVTRDTPPKGTTGRKNRKSNKCAKDTEKGSDADVSLLTSQLEDGLQAMEVDMLNHQEAATAMISDPGALSHDFSTNQSFSDLLNLTNGGIGHTEVSSCSGLPCDGLPMSLDPVTNNNTSPPSKTLKTDTQPPVHANNLGNLMDSNGQETNSSSQNGVPSTESQTDVNAETEPKVLSKDELLKQGLTADTASGISVTDIFLMMGQPAVLKFEYDFVKKKQTSDVPSNGQMINKLVHVAKCSFTEVVKPKKYVSVGVVTSPMRTTRTPPSKSQPVSNHKSPSTNSRSPRGGSRGSSRGGTNSKAASKTSATNKPDDADERSEERSKCDSPQFAVPLSVAPAPARRTEPSHVVAGQQVLDQLEQMKRPQANFLLPRRRKKQRGQKPLVVQRTLLPRPMSQTNPAHHMMSMAIVSNSSHANMGQFMPVKVNMSSLGKVVPPRTLPRPIVPNTSLAGSTAVAGVGKDSTQTVEAQGTGVPHRVIRRIIPVNISNSSSGEGNIPPPGSPALDPTQVIQAPIMSSHESQVNLVSTSELSSSPSPSNLSPPPPLDVSTPRHPISAASTSVLNTPVIVDRGLETPSSTNDGPPPTGLEISPPEISSLLDISLTASETEEGMASISIDSTTFSTFGRNISAVSPNSTTTELLNSTLSRDIGNRSPTDSLTTGLTSSPFKINSLGPEAQWFNGESLDISMSSLLGHLESPEKKDKSNSVPLGTTQSSSSSLGFPPGLLSEASRDSIMSRDVDSTLQVMMNENSIDYVAKFADLAAHISATPDAQHKTNIIDKAFAAEAAEKSETEIPDLVQQSSEVVGLVDACD